VFYLTFFLLPRRYEYTNLVLDELYIHYTSWWENLLTLGLLPAVALVYFNTRIYRKIR